MSKSKRNGGFESEVGRRKSDVMESGGSGDISPDIGLPAIFHIFADTTTKKPWAIFGFISTMG